MRKSDDETLIAALFILSIEIESEDGVANSAIREAAERMQELVDENKKLLNQYLEKCSESHREKLMENIDVFKRLAKK